MGDENVMLAGNPSGRRWSYDDLLQFPEDDRLRHEIISGVHYVTPAPNLRHQDLVGRLFLSVGGSLQDRDQHGRLFLSPFDVLFSLYDVVEPDLVFVATDQLSILTEKNIQGSPALVVEILSPSTRARDRELKRDLYDRFGVREYWIVDPEGDSVAVYRREQQGSLALRGSLTAQANDTLTTPLVPEWSLALAHLFR